LTFYSNRQILDVGVIMAKRKVGLEKPAALSPDASPQGRLESGCFPVDVACAASAPPEEMESLELCIEGTEQALVQAFEVIRTRELVPMALRFSCKAGEPHRLRVVLPLVAHAELMQALAGLLVDPVTVLARG
jgi:hypothetical protein